MTVAQRRLMLLITLVLSLPCASTSVGLRYYECTRVLVQVLSVPWTHVRRLVGEMKMSTQY